MVEDWKPDQEKNVVTTWKLAFTHFEKTMDWVVNMSILSINPSWREIRR